MGRLVHQVMLPWATEERGWKGTNHQTTELFVQAAFGPWQGSTALSCSTMSASRFARREHVSSHTHYPFDSVNVYHSQLKAETVNAIPLQQ